MSVFLDIPRLNLQNYGVFNMKTLSNVNDDRFFLMFLHDCFI